MALEASVCLYMCCLKSVYPEVGFLSFVALRCNISRLEEHRRYLIEQLKCTIEAFHQDISTRMQEMRTAYKKETKNFLEQMKGRRKYEEILIADCNNVQCT